MPRFLLLFFVICLAPFAALFAQTPYWVFFNERDSAAFHEAHVSPQTLENRSIMGLPAHQWSDVPPAQAYIKKLAKLGKVRVVSRWLNAVSVDLTPEALQEVENWPEVAGIQPLKSRFFPTQHTEKDSLKTHRALQQMRYEALHEKGLDGSGVTVGVIDAGFLYADSGEQLKYLFENDSTGVFAVRDFVNPSKTDYFGERETFHDTHGTTVLTRLAGKSDKAQDGLATGARFALARTDHGKNESRHEEDLWVAAMEWMDSLGVRLINTSLGYSTGHDDKNEDYKPAEMDGKTSIIARAARQAVCEKGIALVVSAGNEGDLKNWRIVSTPGDVPEVISVGATNRRGLKAGYSSLGPHFLEVVKPDVACFANFGTSFSAPSVTGLCACLLQAKPELKPLELQKLLHEGSTLYPFANNYLGYGVPQADRLLKKLAHEKVQFHKTVKAKKGKFEIPNIGEAETDDDILIFHKSDERTVQAQENLRVGSKDSLKPLNKKTKFTTVYLPDGRVFEVKW